jgi:hypothetical protein
VVVVEIDQAGGVVAAGVEGRDGRRSGGGDWVVPDRCPGAAALRDGFVEPQAGIVVVLVVVVLVAGVVVERR